MSRICSARSTRRHALPDSLWSSSVGTCAPSCPRSCSSTTARSGTESRASMRSSTASRCEAVRRRRGCAGQGPCRAACSGTPPDLPQSRRGPRLRGCGDRARLDLSPRPRGPRRARDVKSAPSAARYPGAAPAHSVARA